MSGAGQAAWSLVGERGPSRPGAPGCGAWGLGLCRSRASSWLSVSAPLPALLPAVPVLSAHLLCPHPPVYPDGRVCISILHAPGDDPMGYESSAERWSPVQSVEKILLSVVSMLAGKAAPGGGGGRGAQMSPSSCVLLLCSSVTVVSVRASSTYAVSAFSRNYWYTLFVIMSLYVGQSEPRSGPRGSRSWSR